jgi:hypothetical protein
MLDRRPDGGNRMLLLTRPGSRQDEQHPDAIGVAAEKEPFAHCAQAVAPGAGAKVPAGQSAQAARAAPGADGGVLPGAAGSTRGGAGVGGVGGA